MANTNHLDIINGIIGTLRESDAFNDLLLGDPGIKAAETGLEEIMEKVSSHIPDDLYSDLSEAVTSYVSAHIDPVLLFGMDVARAFQDVCSNPTSLSGFQMSLRHS